MRSYTWNFSFDASGSPDAVVLPADFPPGLTTIKLWPPDGHAWTWYGPGQSIGVALQPDVPVELRANGGAFVAGETIGAAALDTGSTTAGKGLAA